MTFAATCATSCDVAAGDGEQPVPTVHRGLFGSAGSFHGLNRHNGENRCARFGCHGLTDAVDAIGDG
jgi:hypothetical protein